MLSQAVTNEDLYVLVCLTINCDIISTYNYETAWLILQANHRNQHIGTENKLEIDCICQTRLIVKVYNFTYQMLKHIYNTI